MAIRAIIFDIGGVLEYTPPTGWVERWEGRLALAAGGLHARLRETFGAGSLGTISEAEVSRRIGAVMGMERAHVDAMMGDMWEEYVGTPNTELIAYFATLRPRFRTGILSNSIVGAREREEALYGFGGLCEHIIYSHEVGMRKPEPRIFALTCERFGVRPDEMIFLDDVAENVAAARAHGIHAIHFTDNARAIAAIEACIAGAGNPTSSGSQP